MAQKRTRQVQQRRPTPVGEAYAAFITARQAQNVTPRTLGYYADKLHPFITHCETHGAPTVDQVSAATVRAYLVHLQQRGLAPATVHGAARAIRAWLRFCAADGLIDDAPKFSMPKLPKTILPAFEAADAQRLLSACDRDRDRLAVLVLLDTGVRAAEFVALNGGDIDERSGAVAVRQGKGRKQRTVYLGAKTRRELAKFWRTEGKPPAHGPVFANLRTGERLTESGLRQLLQRIGERAGVKHCHPHTFRRTFALWSLRAGMSIFHLQRLMGHEDIHVLKQYLALVDADLQRAHGAAGPVDRLLKR